MNDLLDAIVVGAGPTGLAAAGDLMRHGMRVRIIDQAEHPTTLSKAVVVMPRTLEAFAARGLADATIARGVKSTSLCTYSGGRMIFLTRYDQLATRFSFLVDIAQSDTETILRDHLESLGGRV
jgi:NADPH-dependent dioxygenase